jgi:RimJ/RimL family protein N-acetyltransferase
MLTNTYLGPHNKEAVEDDVIKAIFRGSETLFGAAVTLKDGTFLGWTTIRCYNPKNRDGEFGIAILPAFWNKGYGTEVTRFIINHSFRELGLHRVSLHVFEDNTNAIELYKGL